MKLRGASRERDLAGKRGHMPECTVVIPTLAVAERSSLLRRAIASLQQNRSLARILVVVNGAQFSRELLESLDSRGDVEVLRVERASLPAAIAAGRDAVRSPFFSFLDDDDEYLPGAVDIRLELLKREATASLGVTNGLRQASGRSLPVFRELERMSADPLRTLFCENWLASCGAIYRTAELDRSHFADLPPYLEWTFLAFQIASAGKRVVTTDAVTFRINETEGSLSSSRAYERNGVSALNRMLVSTSRPDIRRLIKRRIAQAWHTCSDFALQAGERREALHCHLKSLSYISGWRYLPYSRRLLPRWTRQAGSARQPAQKAEV